MDNGWRSDGLVRVGDKATTFELPNSTFTAVRPLDSATKARASYVRHCQLSVVQHELQTAQLLMGTRDGLFVHTLQPGRRVLEVLVPPVS